MGGGGREHALAWRLAQSPLVTQLFAAPGNPGIAALAKCLDAPATIEGYADLAEAHRIDLTVVGPEATLVAGIVDRFRERNLKIVGPTQAAARLEGSKLFAKAFFERAGIPTARSSDRLNDFNYPVVVKADGLAAGKGVVIAQTPAEAKAAIERLGPRVLLEEFLEGEEVSFIGLCNGKTVVPFLPTQDHKRLLDNDQGPNTGGMGAYVDPRILTAAQTGEIMDRIMLPAVAQLDFTGFLYAGLMMTAEGPKVLEFNVRLGDPETQALLHNFSGDLAAALLESATGGTPTLQPTRTPAPHALSSPPKATPKKYALAIPSPVSAKPNRAEPPSSTPEPSSRTVPSSRRGGRVLGVTAKAPTLKEAIENAYRAVEKIHFTGMQYRRDIGAKGLRRW